MRARWVAVWLLGVVLLALGAAWLGMSAQTVLTLPWLIGA